MKNIYGKKLKPCRIFDNDSSGSWDSRGYCSEVDGGVHQICFDINDATQDFSRHTYQSDWSKSRKNKNHCMCLGAWSLYKARQLNNEIPYTFNELNCDAIPEEALKNDYISKWNTWNGHELPGQVVVGVKSLVDQCSKVDDLESRRYLQKLSKKLYARHPELALV